MMIFSSICQSSFKNLTKIYPVLYRYFPRRKCYQIFQILFISLYSSVCHLWFCDRKKMFCFTPWLRFLKDLPWKILRETWTVKKKKKNQESILLWQEKKYCYCHTQSIWWNKSIEAFYKMKRCPFYYFFTKIFCDVWKAGLRPNAYKYHYRLRYHHRIIVNHRIQSWSQKVL